MKFWEVFTFEFSYQIRRPWPWLFMIVLIVLDFLMTRDGSVSEVMYSDFYLNSPFGIAKTTVFGGLLWLVMAGAIAGDAASRDIATRIHPLIYTSPLSKLSYFGGKCFAALAMNLLILLSVQIGILLGVYLPGVDAELIGPFRPEAFLTTYGYLSVPNAFAATAVQFALASLTGRAMGAYFGSFLMVFMGFFVASLLLFKQSLGTLLDPIGIRFVVEDMARMWTTVEKNVRLLQLEGPILTNRIVWISLGAVFILYAFLRFSFRHYVQASLFLELLPFLNSRSISSTKKPNTLSPSAVITDRKIIPTKLATGFRLHLRQVMMIAWTSFRTLAMSWAGLAMLLFIPLLCIPVLIDQMNANDVPLLPTTIRILGELTGPLSDELSRWVIVPFIIVFFAGELIWREREARIGDITDAMPGSEWAPFLGKFLGLALVLVTFLTLQIAAGILSQLMLGYNEHEFQLYAKVMFGLQLTDYLLFAVLALTVHVIVNNKYVGHLVAILIFVFMTISPLFGIEHNLLVFGASPSWSYTQMRGFGLSLGPWIWFKLYWTGWALLLAVTARLFWTRGRNENLKARWEIAKNRITKSTVLTGGIAIALIASTGGFIFYNTNILNQYISSSELKERSAEYERLYARIKNTQPRVKSAKLKVDVYPVEHRVDISGTYVVVNRNDAPIEAIHLDLSPIVETEKLEFSKAADLVENNEKLFHRAYALKEPLMPGDSLELNFDLRCEPKGFQENGVDVSIVPNGTNFTNAWLPHVGYQTMRELHAPSDRRNYGLSARPVIPRLEDQQARKNRGEGIQFEAVVSTSANEFGIAPGDLKRTWSENNRQYSEYRTSAPIGGTWEFFSGRYDMREVLWTNPDDSNQTVKIRLFHYNEHTSHVERVLKSVTSSMEYYSKEFGAYRFNHLTIAERAGNGTGMHAEASMISHGEGFTSWNPETSPGSHDHPYAIVAHEMAHQWTVPYAAVEGAPVMSESLAWYFGMKMVEHTKGKRALRRLLDFMHQPNPYPPIRRGEPVLRGLDPYLSYRRGPFAMYTMSEYIGEDKVNAALRQLRENHTRKDSPLATTLDLYNNLHDVTPDSLKFLLHDFFEANTYWDLELQRVEIKKATDATWDVEIDIAAEKSVYDSAGVETAVKMDEWVEIGIYSPNGHEQLHLQKHRLHSGKQSLKINITARPSEIVVDPKRLLIDMNYEDNSRQLEIPDNDGE